MSMPLLMYWVLAKMMSAIDSAPLGNGIFDPLVPSVETSNGYLSNEMAIPILRKDISPEESIDTEHYEGYIFNQNRCIQFNNRILCGYDKNHGTLLDDYTMLDIGNGCRSRGDRIECGYDNPHNKDLRRPVLEHGEHEEHSEHVEHDALHENRHHHAGYHHHRGNHHQLGHHHENKHEGSLARQAPTRTVMTTDTTTESIILNRIKTDFLENTLLKSAFSKLVMKAEDTTTGSAKPVTDLIKPIKLSTDPVKPLTPTTTKPTTRKSTLTSKRQKTKTTNKATTTTKATRTTSTPQITTTLATDSESNDISDGETIKRIVKLAPVRKQKRRRLTEKLSTLPKLLNKFIITDGTVVPPIINKYETTSKRAVLRKKTSSEEKVTTACVEQGDRVVCYNFKT